MRGWVYRLKLLLALASEVILGSEFRGTRNHILLSEIRNFPFSSPPTTRKAAVELFDPASTRGLFCRTNSLSVVASRSCRKDRVENTDSQLAHWCSLGICCLGTGVVYRVVT
jgi:hypothetical protein